VKSTTIPLNFEKPLARLLSLGRSRIEVIGTDSPLALAFFLSQMREGELSLRPQLIITADAAAAQAFARQLSFFTKDLSAHVLPGFDVSPYSGLYPSPQSVSGRLRWLHQARTAQMNAIFAAPIEALLQKTLPAEVLHASTYVFRVGEEWPDGFSRKLDDLGYQAVPLVEDIGTYAKRGGIIDVHSPAHALPVRVELFGDTIESLRFFDSETQRSLDTIQSFTLIPPREVLYSDQTRELASRRFRENTDGRGDGLKVDETDRDQILQALAQGRLFPGIDFLLGDFYSKLGSPIDFVQNDPIVWILNPLEVFRQADLFHAAAKKEFEDSASHAIRPAPLDLFCTAEELGLDAVSTLIQLSKIEVFDRPFEQDENQTEKIFYSTSQIPATPATTAQDVVSQSIQKIQDWRDEGWSVFIAASTQSQCQRIQGLFERTELETRVVGEASVDFSVWLQEQRENANLLHLIPSGLNESLRFPEERIVFLRDDEIFGQKRRRREYKSSGTLEQRTHSLSFGDLKPGDAVVHVLHGIGVYEGLKLMPIQGVQAEYIQIGYKDGDKLYLPIYRIAQIQKYSGPSSEKLIDRLGGTQWQKTKTKVRHHLRELAAELLALYAKRSQIHRPPLHTDEDEFHRFEGFFPYDETDDQLRAVNDIINDLHSDRPMDRLVCGDVGFGKTEVAMRAAFKAVQAKKQVAVLAPTTVLTFQHLETFQRRFSNWPLRIRALNRFVPNAEVKKTLQELREGTVDICIGTHRLLSKDIQFKDLGLLIVDEEQKFGVTHKERIKKLKTAVDTLTLSATPIPRTLNMSLVGMRDLSIINTAPIDRLPTRTFVCKYDEETIRKAILAEVQRGGQVFFLHNRVQSIYSVADELRRIVPEVRLRVGHGQMDEEELEKTMVAFFNHEIDVLLCTTIIESGIDNPRANTMFIDDAHMFGLSQLYQLRGRVGRSKERAYCYLLIPSQKRLEPDAQERLKVIQENTALGSGIRIAHHDLELRGSGNVLGEDQSGHIDSVGYEMYLELLEEAIHEVKGEPLVEQVEPDINVRIPAYIPDNYMPDIRIRLSYYKALAEIKAPEDMDRIEDELRDQFGKLPDEVINLMGLMLIRHHCRELGVRDLSSGTKTISLSFTENTPLPATKVVSLAQLENKKFSITPDNRLIVRMNNITWPNIYEELLYLRRLC